MSNWAIYDERGDIANFLTVSISDRTILLPAIFRNEDDALEALYVIEGGGCLISNMEIRKIPAEEIEPVGILSARNSRSEYLWKLAGTVVLATINGLVWGMDKHRSLGAGISGSLIWFTWSIADAFNKRKKGK